MAKLAIAAGLLFLCSCNTSGESTAPTGDADIRVLAERIDSLEQDVAILDQENEALTTRLAQIEALPEILSDYFPIVADWVQGTIDLKLGNGVVRVARLPRFAAFFKGGVEKGKQSE